jgi:anti-anti-sigma factor
VPEAASSRRNAASLDVAFLPFVCSWHADDSGAAWVQAAGELDLATSPQLRQTLREAQRAFPLVVLDLRELTFMDSSGIHLIMGVASEARSGDNWLLVVRGSAQVERLLTLTGVRAQVLIFDLNPLDQAPLLRIAPPCSDA